MGRTNPYIRVGNDYYKLITNQDVSGVPYEDMKPIARITIMDDHGKEFLKEIPHFDAFTNIPIHGSDIEIIGNLYNLYTPIRHYPHPGEWPWTEILLRHVFGDQYELGLDYIKLLWERPTQILPILCPVSRENVTGKTTLLNWLRMLFNGNMIILGNQDIHGRFNSHYANKLIIAVDESKIDKQSSLEKLKALATQRTINIEGKFQNVHTVPFFGKFILCSNNEDDFIDVRDEDIRYWIRKLERPRRMNINIEADLEREIPAFLFDLIDRPYSTENQSRMWFTPDQIKTIALEMIREATKSSLYKDIHELVESFFLNDCDNDEFQVDPNDIKARWFMTNNQVTRGWIIRVLRQEFKLEPQLTARRYTPWNEIQQGTKVGRCYTFRRSDFTVIASEDKEIVTDLPF